jgi:hypothetical protein
MDYTPRGDAGISEKNRAGEQASDKFGIVQRQG